MEHAQKLLYACSLASKDNKNSGIEIYFIGKTISVINSLAGVVVGSFR